MTLSTVWASLINVLLVVLLGRGVHRVYRTAAVELPQLRLERAYVVAALSFFVAYDIIVYNLLVHRLPYTMTPVGASRFMLDLAMNLCIYVMLRRGMSAGMWSEGLALVCTLTLWHLLAILWHMMAHYERSESPPWPDYIPHLLFCAIYVSAYLVFGFVRRRSSASADAAVRRFVLVLATLVFGISAFRLWQLCRRYG